MDPPRIGTFCLGYLTSVTTGHKGKELTTLKPTIISYNSKIFVRLIQLHDTCVNIYIYTYIYIYVFFPYTYSEL